MAPRVEKYEATLTRGLTYFMGSTRFDRNVPVTISAADKEYLEANAVDEINTQPVEGEDVEVLRRQKFKFKAIASEDGGEEEEEAGGDGEGEGDPPPAPTATKKVTAPRRRTRA